MSDIYPLVIVKDRYNGTYSGGKWIAWNLSYVPSKAVADDTACIEFFSTTNIAYGRGETPEEAIEDLKMILDCGISDPDESTESEENSKLKKGDYILHNAMPYMPSDIERLLTGIRRLEKKNEKLEEKIKNLEHADMIDKEAADYWSKEYDTLSERFTKLQEENDKLKDKLENVEPFRALEQTIREKQELKKELALEKAANEAQRKFITLYAGKGTEVQFNYAIDETGEVSYVVVEKERYQDLKDNGYRAMIHGKIYTMEQLVNMVLELTALKTPTLENFADEEPSTRADILDQAKKCVCGQREQDYGTPESNFQLIADLWNGYLGEKTDNPVISVTPVDVSMMMALMKIARIRNGGGSGDSFVDLAGYAACGGEIWHGQKVKDQN